MGIRDHKAKALAAVQHSFRIAPEIFRDFMWANARDSVERLEMVPAKVTFANACDFISNRYVTVDQLKGYIDQTNRGPISFQFRYAKREDHNLFPAAIETIDEAINGIDHIHQKRKINHPPDSNLTRSDYFSVIIQYYNDYYHAAKQF